jgi:hypothetical protein
MSADPADAIRRRDEVLQVMFWMLGEGLGAEVGVANLRMLLDEVPADTLGRDLESLASSGLVEPAGKGLYRLTAAGLEEGGRRFHDEFSDYMRQGHGACSDPNCDCHALGPEACAHVLH